MKKGLAAARGTSPAAKQPGRALMHALIAEAAAASDQLSSAQMCRVLAFPRATYDRGDTPVRPLDGALAWRAHMQSIALEMPAYGYRRITHELQRRGLEANHKRVLRLMHEDNLRCLRKKAFVRTTDSHPRVLRYPTLLPALAVSGVNQRWVADITSIRLQREFVYLAVILDGYSRRCIGGALERSLEADLALVALRMALAPRQVQPGLVHHSDRGVPYASHADTNRLKEHGIRISMSRGGNPDDKAQAARFLKTLKGEEVDMCEYQHLAEARVRIGHCLDTVYHRQRLHSALGS